MPGVVKRPRFRITNVLYDVEILGVTCRNMAHLITKMVPVLMYDCFDGIDMTPGQGRFWSKDEPMPFNVLLSPNDFLDSPYDEEQFDAVFFDPPHAAGLGTNAYFKERYGTYSARELPGVISEGTRECWRICRKVLVVKVTDHVNSARFQRQTGWVIDAIRQEPYQVITVVHGAVGSARWKGFNDGDEPPPQSARSISSTLLVFRRGSQEHSAPARFKRSVALGLEMCGVSV